MAQVAIAIDDEQRRVFRRVLIFSALAHVAGVALLGWVPSTPSMGVPAAISVNLVASPRPAPRPAPKAPAPKAPPEAAKPKPRPPKPAPVVLPAEPRMPKPKPVKRKPEPEIFEEPEPVAEENYADVMASLRSELGEEPEPEPVQTAVQTAAAAPAGPPAGAPGGVPVSAEVRNWIRAARVRIKQNWVVPPSFRMAAIAAEVRIEVDAGGGVVGSPRLVAGSGNPYYDEGVLRSIQKASPLPPPPEAGEWTFRFVSDDF